MTYKIILTKEQEQKNMDWRQLLNSLKYNSMCYTCKRFKNDCMGSTSKVYDGCIYKMETGVSIYALAILMPELIKNEDFSSFEDFLEAYRENKDEFVKYIQDRVRGDHFKDEAITPEYIETCKKVLQVLGEEIPE